MLKTTCSNVAFHKNQLQLSAEYAIILEVLIMLLYIFSGLSVLINLQLCIAVKPYFMINVLSDLKYSVDFRELRFSISLTYLELYIGTVRKF